MKVFIFLFACFFSVTVYGQTKLIAFRSHSGSNAHFHTAVENSLFDIGNSNFGLTAENVIKIHKVELKSSRYIIVSYESYWLYRPFNTIRYRSFKTDTLTKKDATELFSAGSIDSLQAGLKRIKKYRYLHPIIDSTNYIGFEKQFRKNQANGN